LCRAKLSAAQQLYGSTFNPQITLKARSFFDDGDLPLLSEEMKLRLATAAREVELDSKESSGSSLIREHVSDEDFREALDRAPPGIIDPRSSAYTGRKFKILLNQIPDRRQCAKVVG
jgi:hypothetical protein